MWATYSYAKEIRSSKNRFRIMLQLLFRGLWCHMPCTGHTVTCSDVDASPALGCAAPGVLSWLGGAEWWWSAPTLTYLTSAVRVVYILQRSFNKVSTQLPDGRAVCTSSWKNVSRVPNCMMVTFSMGLFVRAAWEEASSERKWSFSTFKPNSPYFLVQVKEI